MSGSWSVDAAGVMGVLARVDDTGNELEIVSRRFGTVQQSGENQLVKNGRKTLAGAWSEFCEERTDVPKKLMAELQRRCGQVTEASVAVLTGDFDMGAATANTEGYALSEWGIHSDQTYSEVTAEYA